MGRGQNNVLYSRAKARRQHLPLALLDKNFRPADAETVCRLLSALTWAFLNCSTADDRLLLSKMNEHYTYGDEENLLKRAQQGRKPRFSSIQTAFVARQAAGLPEWELEPWQWDHLLQALEQQHNKEPDLPAKSKIADCYKNICGQALQERAGRVLCGDCFKSVAYLLVFERPSGGYLCEDCMPLPLSN